MTQTELLDRDGKVTDIARARHERNDGMERAADHAERDCPGWGGKALAYLRRYAESHDQFVGWFVTNEAELSGSVEAPDTRKAWGSVFIKAARLGWIERCGYRPDPNRHANPAPLWRSKIFQE